MLSFSFFALWLLIVKASEAHVNVVSTIHDGILNNTDIELAPFKQIGEGYYYVESNEKLNWFAAHLKCRQMQAQLIAFETTQEWAAISSYLESRQDTRWYWTSGSDLSHEGNFYWFATGSAVSITSKWAPNQPDNYNGNENCAHLGFWNNTIKNALDDRPCNQEFYYICELNEPKTVSFIVW